MHDDYLQILLYEEAIQMAAVKRFHIYEGGEGKLTKQHAWMHVLYGNELAKAGDAEKAEQIYRNGINMPKSYGEAKTFFNQEAHIYYYLSKLYTGDKRTEALEKAAEYKAAVSEISLFRALALKELDRADEAKTVLDEMLSTAQNLIDNKDMRTYGDPMPGRLGGTGGRWRLVPGGLGYPGYERNGLCA